MCLCCSTVCCLEGRRAQMFHWKVICSHLYRGSASTLSCSRYLSVLHHQPLLNQRTHNNLLFVLPYILHSFCLTQCLCVCLSVSVFQSVNVCLLLPLYLFIFRCLCLSVFLGLCLSLNECPCIPFCLLVSVCLTVLLFNCICLSFFLSAFFTVEF